MKKAVIKILCVIGFVAVTSTAAFAHGNVTPQPVDTTGLKSLGEEWLESNPFRGNKKAIEIGEHGYSSNCAGCHGLHAVSGGLAPDLRELEEGADGDEWFIMRARNGVIRNGKVYCPKFEGIMSQEAMWAIRTWLESLQTH
ncbi:MAG: cytochrome c-550 PedF [Alphaproteobacteria bacterium]|nr:cytochrome c-550 PedF [Rhodospirillales bacterium]MCW9045445.1 cytochrome c-550 PedF [Alphaproteobacteria bacterium]